MSDMEKVPPPKSAGMSDPKFARWIRGQYHTKKIGKIELVHASQGGTARLCTWDKDKLAGKDPDTLIQEIYAEAQDDAQNFRGPQRYVIYFYEDGQQGANRKVFVVEGQPSEDEDGELEGSNEPATGKGHLAQMMRHNESYMRMAIGNQRETMGIMKSLLVDVVGELKQHKEVHFKVMDLYSQLQDRVFERDMEREDKKTMRSLKEQAGTMLMSQAPTLLNMFASRLSSSDEKQQRDAQIKLMISQFARSLNSEQMEALLQPLTNDQRIVFMQLYNDLRDEYLASPEGQAEIKRAQEAQAAAQAAEAEAKAHVDRVRAEAEAAAAQAKAEPEVEIDRGMLRSDEEQIAEPIITPPPVEETPAADVAVARPNEEPDASDPGGSEDHEG